MNFKQLGIDESISRALSEIGRINPTPVQRKAIAPIKEGKDLLCCANEKYGKTISFAVPMLDKMGKPKPSESRKIKSVVLASSRQAAMQIYGDICQCGRYLGRIAAVIYSGASEIPQIAAINRGADILVATPLRLIEFLDRGLISLDKTEYFVICDADKMLEKGLLNAIKDIKLKLPKRHQTFLFAEDLSSELRNFAQKMLNRPFRIDMNMKKHHKTAARTSDRVPKGNKAFAEKTRKPINRAERASKPNNTAVKKSSYVRDEFKMDISTPRTAELSEETMARIRAKVQAKLKEREEVQRKAYRPDKSNKNTNKKSDENKKTFRRYNRTRGRGNRKQAAKE